MMKIRALKQTFFEKTCRLFVVFCLVLFLGTSVFAQTGDPTTTGTSGSALSTGKGVPFGEPISASNGAYYFSKPLLSLGGPMGFRADLGYRSNHGGGFPIPRGFLLNLFSFADTTLIGGKLYATVWLGTGDQVAFKKVSGNWILTDPTEILWGFTFVDQRPQRKYVFKETTNYAYLLDPIAERVYIFYKYQDFGSGQWIARIVRIMDRNGNQLIYTYPSPTAVNPSRIEDGLGRFLNLVYTQFGFSTFLSTITDQGGRIVRFNYEAQGTDNNSQPTLRSVTDPMNQTTTFQYFVGMDWSNLIASEKLPKGNTPYTQMYGESAFYSDTDSFPRVTRQTDAYNNQTTLSYDGTNHILDATYPDSATEKYKHHSTHGFPEYITDRAGKTIQFTRNADEEHITGMTDKKGDIANYAYHAETGRPASGTNANGKTITYAYAPQDQTFTNPLFLSENVNFTFYNLSRVDYPDGTNEQFTYDGKGNVVNRTDRAGNIRTYTRNSRGQVLTITNPAGGVITYVYNADGTLASRNDSDTGTTVYGHDTYKRVVKITYPDGMVFEIAYNLNGQITSLHDENNHTTTFAYDANGNLTSITDPLGHTTQFSHNDMDLPTQMTDRLGKNTTYAYDALNRLSSITDPAGMRPVFGYDARNWLNQVSYGARSWRIGLDDEGSVISRTTPAGRVTTLENDKLGLLARIQSPLGHSTAISRDAMGRIIGLTDPLGRTTTYGLDGRDLLTSVTMPVIGTSAYQRGALGQITQITDPNSQPWQFTWTSMGRLQAENDPLGRTWQYTHDNRGRLSQTIYPDGGTLTRTYSGGNNLTRRLYSNGLDLQYNYDALNRLTGANDLEISYDAGGRVINTENQETGFGATYDDAGRLKTVTYNNGAFTVTYAYESETGLLSLVSDSLTGTEVSFTYDADMNLVGLTRSNGVNTILTLDNGAQLIRIQDGPSTGSGFLDLQYTLDAAGQVTGLNMTAPLDPRDFLVGGTDTFTCDAASQISTSGYSYDQRARMTASPGHTFTWDGASRLVSLNNTTLAYNGVDDLVSRTEGEQSIHYYHNYALGLNPIVAEKNEGAGQFRRYYIWAPDGMLLYMIDAADGNKVYFYHFDHIGSTLAMTNGNGTVTDAYAYDPHGKLLAHQGNSTQPFTFVGKWGVRLEGSAAGSGNGTLYHMRARYYDAVTARFLSRDSEWPSLGSPGEINPYTYAATNPINNIDAMGTQSDGPMAGRMASGNASGLLKGVGGEGGGSQRETGIKGEEVTTDGVYKGQQQVSMGAMAAENWNNPDMPDGLHNDGVPTEKVLKWTGTALNVPYTASNILSCSWFWNKIGGTNLVYSTGVGLLNRLGVPGSTIGGFVAKTFGVASKYSLWGGAAWGLVQIGRLAYFPFQSSASVSRQVGDYNRASWLNPLNWTDKLGNLAGRGLNDMWNAKENEAFREGISAPENIKVLEGPGGKKEFVDIGKPIQWD
jgi:RHS repeat-associated protein